MHRTDVFAGNNRSTAAIDRSKMSHAPSSSCRLTPAGLLNRLVVLLLLLHQIPSSVANGKVTSRLVLSFFFFFICLGAFGQEKSQNKMSALEPSTQFSICPDMSKADALPPSNFS
jgi:hypothetical protein